MFAMLPLPDPDDAPQATDSLVQPLEDTRRVRLQARGLDAALLQQAAVRLVLLMVVVLLAVGFVLWSLSF